VVNNWHFSLCCLFVSSQSMSRNNTKVKAGVGVLALPPAQAERVDLAGSGIGLGCIREQQANLHAVARAKVDLAFVTARSCHVIAAAPGIHEMLALLLFAG